MKQSKWVCNACTTNGYPLRCEVCERASEAISIGIHITQEGPKQVCESCARCRRCRCELILNAVDMEGHRKDNIASKHVRVHCNVCSAACIQTCTGCSAEGQRQEFSDWQWRKCPEERRCRICSEEAESKAAECNKESAAEASLSQMTCAACRQDKVVEEQDKTKRRR